MRWGERAEGYGECTVDRVGARVSSDCIALLDGMDEARTDDWTTDFRIFCTPCEWVGLYAMLVRVR